MHLMSTGGFALMVSNCHLTLVVFDTNSPCD